MKVKKIPMRTCVITKECLPKRELLRIVKTPEGDIEIDPIGKVNGRGAYIKKSLEVLEKLKKTNILEQKLECKIPEDIYDRIEELINNENN